ncbi:unnamed protein product [Rotaria magnacalcarata]|uniref:Uncharacterized protein n=1 Tax=Rotaria magnacalcarata TaxID=392030 RepID=A0A816YVK1_9BILA|nr:unnamed protein product [Rotaria magnacalcarata]CAF2165548.1 unnamed protein product [Rotaria magnacalcarata]CAF4014394.1 unnamed protein product [Rotaria magnacalcarata]CAF4193028.1 unnamed protein product [Rotaria magnacalcarata]
MRGIHLTLFFIFVGISPVTLVDPSCKGKLNTNEILREDPRIVSSVLNGKRFVVGHNYDTINIVHVYGGTPYDMGYAFGKLMSEDLQQLVPEYFAYLENKIEDLIKQVPPFIAKWLAELGLRGALDLNYDITRQYTPPWYDEELQGLAAGSGISYKDIRRLNLIPELIKAACSVLGAWGESTASSTTLLHLRSLDWDEKAPIAKYATVTVYHPNTSYAGYADHFHEYYKQKYTTSHTFANFGYAGLVGSIGAYNEVSVGLGQKVWITTEQDITSRFGNPWTYVLRDVIQFSNSLDTALSMLINTQRTCSVHLGLGEFHRNTSINDDNSVGFLGIEYSAKEFNSYSWEDMYNTPNHPILKDIVYWDPHPQPSDHPCFGSLLIDHYNHLDAATIIRNITSLLETGNTLNLILDYGENAAYLAYSAPDDPQGPIEAFNRVHTRIDMTKLFAEPAPYSEDFN